MKTIPISVPPQAADPPSGGRRPMKMILLALGLGLVSPAAYILGATPFAVRGRTSIKEIAGGCVAGALYFAFCQFLVVEKGSQGLAAKWPTLVAMIAPLMVGVVIALVENGRPTLMQGLPMLISGCFGSVAGAMLAGRTKRRADANLARD